MDVLLAWWVALLGTTRINFAGGVADFLFSPFLLLSPIVLLAGAVDVLVRGGRFAVPRGWTRFVALVAALAAVILVSAFLSEDLQVAARRTLLLIVQITSVVLVGLVLANRPDPRAVLARGALLGLAVSGVFNVLQATYWIGGEWIPGPLGEVVSIEPGDYGGIIPRLTAASHDPNHGGMLVLTYMYVVATLAPRGRRRGAAMAVGVVSVVTTLSRSVMLAGLVMLAARAAARAGSRLPVRTAVAAMATVSVLAATMLVAPDTIRSIEAGWEVVDDRFSFEEGSSRVHSGVMARGWEVATYDLRRMAFGMGYGTAYTALQDIFPGNRYGNFHSLFLTLFAESGILAAVLGIVLFAVPLARAGPYRAAIAGALAFNLFQQSQTDPTFWFLMLLAWTGGAWMAAASRADDDLLTPMARRTAIGIAGAGEPRGRFRAELQPVTDRRADSV